MRVAARANFVIANDLEKTAVKKMSILNVGGTSVSRQNDQGFEEYRGTKAAPTL